MYLTKMKLRKKNVSPYMIHGAVESAFPGERKRNLWRIDRVNGENCLLIVSETVPDLINAANQFGYGEWNICDYDRALNRIKTGDCMYFSLRANPVKKFYGKLYACETPEEQILWLEDRSRGFRIKDVTVADCRWSMFYKKDGTHVSLFEATYRGVLTVTDAELFRETLCNGIGRGKAYGMGMITAI